VPQDRTDGPRRAATGWAAIRLRIAVLRFLRHYVRDIVLAAEEELLDRDRKLEEGEAERLRAAFARLEEVKQAIGKVGYAALNRQLPFSANDEWELGELRELIDR
jgi:hypothetical protein